MKTQHIWESGKRRVVGFMQFSNTVFLCFLGLLLIGLSSVARADELPEYWQSQRSWINELGDRACDGSLEDFQKIEMLATKEENPVAMHELAWVIIKRHCHDYGRSILEVSALVERAAELSYPISQYFHGSYMVRASDGDELQRQKGLCWIYKSIEGGYESAATFLAKNYMLGTYVGFDAQRSLSFYKIAKAADIQNENMPLLDAAYGNAVPDDDENDQFISERLKECDPDLG